MDTYQDVAYHVSKTITDGYSTSFGWASRSFGARVQQHIYAIYGLTRIADEIVDTYRGPDAVNLLDSLEAETDAAIQRQYSTNPVLHAFQITANTYNIEQDLLRPFFASMRTDLDKTSFDQAEYETYIHGSAEVVGLMCLKVFCDNNKALYDQLAPAASRLGAAYQKVNFLRDIAADQKELNRFYFPQGNFDRFDEAAKLVIIEDIKNDFAQAVPAFSQLPKEARRAVALSYRYYHALLVKLENTPAATLKKQRVRINNFHKLLIMVLPAKGY